MNAIEVYKKLSKPPEWALKKIEAGRKGGSMNTPAQQRRNEIMREAFARARQAKIEQTKKVYAT